jgi:hypothetical protein
MTRAALAAVLLTVLVAPAWADEASPDGKQNAPAAVSSETPATGAPTGDCGCKGPGGGCCGGAVAAAPSPAPSAEEAPAKSCGCGMKKRETPPAP